MVERNIGIAFVFGLAGGWVCNGLILLSSERQARIGLALIGSGAVLVTACRCPDTESLTTTSPCVSSDGEQHH